MLAFEEQSESNQNPRLKASNDESVYLYRRIYLIFYFSFTSLLTGVDHFPVLPCASYTIYIQWSLASERREPSFMRLYHDILQSLTHVLHTKLIRHLPETEKKTMIINHEDGPLFAYKALINSYVFIFIIYIYI